MSGYSDETSSFMYDMDTMDEFEYIVDEFETDELYECLTEKKDKENNSIKIDGEGIKLYSTDPVTGLDNINAFLIKTKRLMENNPDITYAIGVLNIKDFKVYNDLFGYDEGNKILIYAAEILEELVGNDGYISRAYADTFAMCIPYTLENIEHIVEESKNRLKRMKDEFVLYTYYGWCVANEKDTPINLYIDRANMAMYTIKGNYKVSYEFYNDSMRNKLLKQAEITSEMNDALENNEFTIYLQPQYNHINRSIVGAEALVRWLHPKKGMISPADFIPVFEKNGFITTLDRYVWEMACKTLKKWKDNNMIMVPISVNLSRLDIFDTELVVTLENLVQKYDIDKNFLKLEITESAYVESPERVIAVVKKLQDSGFIIEMDDFGSGYSTLNSLKDVPVDVLKLDLKFISSGNTGRGGNILQSIVRMARWLELLVIAEGVETREQADYLTSIGCSIIQGYYYSKPVTIEEFEKKLLNEDYNILKENVKVKSITDINEMWKPDSQISVLFNGVVGAFGFFEYYNDKLETLRINSHYLDVLGYTEEEYDIFGDKLLQYIHPDDKERYMQTVRRVAYDCTTDEMVECEARWKKVNNYNEYMWLKMRAKLVASSGDRYIFFVSIENIDDKKKLEEKIEGERKHHKLLYQNIPCGVVEFKANKGGILREVISYNNVICKMFDIEYIDCMQLGADVIKENIKNIINDLLHNDHVKISELYNQDGNTSCRIYCIYESKFRKVYLRAEAFLIDDEVIHCIVYELDNDEYEFYKNRIKT